MFLLYLDDFGANSVIAGLLAFQNVLTLEGRYCLFLAVFHVLLHLSGQVVP